MIPSFTAIILLSSPLFVFTSQGSGTSSFRVATRSQTQIEEIKNLSSYLERGCRNCLWRNTKRGNAHAFLCKVPSPLKLPTFRSTTALQRCKLIYAFEGGLRGFGGTTAYTILISSRTMSVQSERFHTLSQRTPFIILFPLHKNKTARELSQRKQDSATRNKYYNICSHVHKSY